MRILVRAPNWLGDCVMATPFLRRLADKRPGAEITVLSRPGLAPLFLGAPGVQRVLSLEPKEGPLALARRLRPMGFEEAYCLPPSFGSAWPLRLAGIPRRVGYPTDFRRALLTHAPALDERRHYVRRYLGLLGEGEGPMPAPQAPRAGPDEAARFLAQSGAGAGRILALAPGSRAEARRWFPERFAQAAQEGAWTSVVILGSREDRAAARAVAAASRRRTVDLCGQTPLPLAVAVLERCAALVTNESGLMHLGWAAGTPLVVLAGPSAPGVTSPFGNKVRILQRRDVPCVPCVRNDCYRPGSERMECLAGIRAEDVLRALKELLG